MGMLAKGTCGKTEFYVDTTYFKSGLGLHGVQANQSIVDEGTLVISKLTSYVMKAVSAYQLVYFPRVNWDRFDANLGVQLVEMKLNCKL